MSKTGGPEYFVEREVVGVLDQLGVRGRKSRDTARKQLVVILLRFCMGDVEVFLGFV